MKKTTVFLLSLIVATSAFAANMEGPDAARHAHRQEMKKIKQAMREERKANPETVRKPGKMDEFMKKEGERSGLGNMGERMGNWTKNLNPMPFFKQQNEQYKARKAAGQVK